MELDDQTLVAANRELAQRLLDTDDPRGVLSVGRHIAPDGEAILTVVVDQPVGLPQPEIPDAFRGFRVSVGRPSDQRSLIPRRAA